MEEVVGKSNLQLLLSSRRRIRKNLVLFLLQVFREVLDIGCVANSANDELAALEGDFLRPGESLLGVLGLDDPVAADVGFSLDIEWTGLNLWLSRAGVLEAIGVKLGRGEAASVNEEAGFVEGFVVLVHLLKDADGDVFHVAFGHLVGLDEVHEARHDWM